MVFVLSVAHLRRIAIHLPAMCRTGILLSYCDYGFYSSLCVTKVAGRHPLVAVGRMLKFRERLRCLI